MKKPVVALKKARTMVPNMLTVGNMALGFFAITAAIEERWIVAAWSIFIAHVLDMLDGRIARWLGETSPFGAEFDSFADWISFGLAPGLIIFLLVLRDFGNLGFLLSFFYVFAGATRLARFNVKSAEPEDEGPKNFSGLPIPGAGGFLAVLILLFGLFQDGNKGRTMDLIYNHIPSLRAALPVIVFCLSMLMISKVEYSAFKKTRIFRPRSMSMLLIVLFVVFLIVSYPNNTIFFLYAGYILFGILNGTWRAYSMRRRSNQKN